MELASVVGIVANLMFGFKSLPQVIKCCRHKSTDGLSISMLLVDSTLGFNS